MKGLLLSLVLLFTINSFAQSNVDGYGGRMLSIGIYQDGKLALFKDDYGNKPFTLDTRIEFGLQGFSSEYGWMTIGAVYEYAELSKSNYARYGFQGGYTFGYMHFFNLFNYELTTLAGYGWISRKQYNIEGGGSVELTCEVGFKLTNNLRGNIKTTLTERTELVGKTWGASIYYGIRYNIPLYNPHKTKN